MVLAPALSIFTSTSLAAEFTLLIIRICYRFVSNTASLTGICILLHISKRRRRRDFVVDGPNWWWFLLDEFILVLLTTEDLVVA